MSILRLVIYDTVFASHATQAPAVMQAAVPIIPLLLLPFILIFFVLVFPVWLVSLCVLWLLASIARAVAPDAIAQRLHRAFRWVLTFGGFTERGKETREP
ncbi:MAG TPA: hypothetical protein VIP11_22265 [Gemmatimonadaceae bacterium]